jgi:hypothetical protein
MTGLITGHQAKILVKHPGQTSWLSGEAALDTQCHARHTPLGSSCSQNTVNKTNAGKQIIAPVLIRRSSAASPLPHPVLTWSEPTLRFITISAVTASTVSLAGSYQNPTRLGRPCSRRYKVQQEIKVQQEVQAA